MDEFETDKMDRTRTKEAGKMTEIIAKSGISGPTIPEVKKILRLLVEIDEHLKKHNLKITTNIIYKQDDKIKIRLDITEVKERKSLC